MSENDFYLSDFDFDLPQELIAQYPLKERSASRLLHITPESLEDLSFADVPDLLQAGDLLGWIYDNLYSTRIGNVYRRDINDKYSYIQKVIIRKMKTESGDDPMQSYGIQ